MITRKETEVFATVAELATYLSLSEYLTTLHKVELESAIEKATVSVENAYNISLRAMTLSLALNYAEGYCPLYQHPVVEVLTEGVEFDGRGITLPTLHRLFVVDYKTAATPDADAYKVGVLSLAGRIYNNEQE